MRLVGIFKTEMGLKHILNKFLNKFNSENFNEILKIVELMGTYTGYNIFKYKELDALKKALVWFGRLIPLLYILQMAWSTYYSWPNFLKFIYYFIFFISSIIYASFQSSWINREDRIYELLHWCQKQSEEPGYRLLKKWPFNYYRYNHLAGQILVTWIVILNIVASSVGIPITSVLLTFYFRKFTLVLPIFAPIENGLNVWTFILSVLEESFVVFHYGTSIGVVYLTFYFTVLYLYFRLEAIEELVKRVSGDLTMEKQSLNYSLIKTIVDLQVDAYE